MSFGAGSQFDSLSSPGLDSECKNPQNHLADRLPTSKSGQRWWVDPIIGLRTQINFTRWLFLALQGDVGGFGAGNIFLDVGYRYFFMEYAKNGVTYDAAQSGLFMGVGVKF